MATISNETVVKCSSNKVKTRYEISDFLRKRARARPGDCGRSREIYLQNSTFVVDIYIGGQNHENKVRMF